MASTLCYNSLNPPKVSSFSRNHYKDLSSDSSSTSSTFHSYGFHLGNRAQKQRKVMVHVRATVAERVDSPSTEAREKKKVRVLVAGGGIGGLVFALAAKKKGFEVMVFEKDLSAVRGEGQYRGPIQIQSNALAALEAIDSEVADEVMKHGCVTGDRINGFKKKKYDVGYKG